MSCPNTEQRQDVRKHGLRSLNLALRRLNMGCSSES
jgi:hypothetical protein